MELTKLEQLNFYSFFTKYSLMEDFGFSSGLIKRLFRKILPVVPDNNTVEYLLLKQDDPVAYTLSLLDLEKISDSTVSQQLDLSIKALCSKLITFGLDSNIKSKYKYINLDPKPFENLLDKINKLSSCNENDIAELNTSLEKIEILITNLRRNKNKIGTSIHLTLTTRRILEYIIRAKELLNLKLNITSEIHWEEMFLKSIEYLNKKNSIRRYVRRHSDLLALEIVEHTSNKGEKYIAEDKGEYWKFFFKSLLGGSIISIFAFIKIIIDSYQLTQLSNALFFSINYALCFIAVKQLGGIIATKQPAMTASTIAKNIDKQDNLKIDSIHSITLLIRKVFRTQFISIIGNFLMALSLAIIIMFFLRLFDLNDLTKIIKPKYLIDNVLPSKNLVFFATIAGFFLAVSGLISGYIDNKVIASKVAYRISNSRLFFKNGRLAAFIEKKAGALIGNLSLGFLLGSVFLLSNLLPFQVDIRHIAFSTSYVGFSVMSYDFTIDVILLALSGALLIGLINFVVSFSITLYLALKSRNVSLRLVPKIILDIIKDFIRHPFHYFFYLEDKPHE